jgi:hypothetical protein
MRWTQDKADYSWIATDALGCVYRVAKVNGTALWICAWTEEAGPRIGSVSYANADRAKWAMDNIAATEETHA